MTSFLLVFFLVFLKNPLIDFLSNTTKKYFLIAGSKSFYKRIILIFEKFYFKIIFKGETIFNVLDKKFVKFDFDFETKIRINKL